MLAGKNHLHLQILGKVASRWTGSCKDLKNTDQIKYVKNYAEDPQKKFPHTTQSNRVRSLIVLKSLGL